MAKKVFQVSVLQVRARTTPGLQGALVKWIPSGQQLEVDAATRTEADGYVWWKHADGWSAERSLDGKEVFLTEVMESAPVAAAAQAMAAAAASASAVPSQAAPMKKKTLKVGKQQVRVRAEPALKGAMVRWLNPGEIVELDAGSRTEVANYVWWKHAEGWSVERSVDGREVYLVDPAIEITAQTVVAGKPDINTLPLVNMLFQRWPVDLDKTLWWQYFGNNVFAYNLWRDGKHWYRYCQGLHGGLDFGNSSAPGVLVYAGLQGQFLKLDTQYTQPNGLWVRAGDYTVIYGHLTNPRPFNPGDTIMPDTVMGEIQFGGQNHLHLEIRYRDRWVINPLPFFPESMRSDILRKFPPSDRYFYRDAGWTQWQTPFDQPVLELGGALIGPHAR